ncbi:hypothetical protein PGT21_025943 [Puccinia graminis f. sp. tritici]|uniref:C2H2-type domain-containing protein n=1 Tax=Puccinia graminis f. sp. tritici TaxID=56615 RepID=A0A5B0QP13_PUCGR|nr:hypothetical protein PGT21_025943 [Puccinia graminis f. sp. tritici]KAA1127053.1 hypothetical protein PGTUg99_014313 [Puccinia graminis f. sp. tritici]
MNFTRLIIVCAVSLQLIMNTLALPPVRCAQIGCGKSRQLSQAEVIGKRFELEGDCGELVWKGAWVNCKNRRIKLYFQCHTCHRFFRQNQGPTRDNPDKTCANHYNKEFVYPEEMDLIGTIGDAGPSKAADS